MSTAATDFDRPARLPAFQRVGGMRKTKNAIATTRV